MKQPTKEEITQNVKMFLDGKMNREDICSWAMNFIRNDERIIIDDVEAWHYLVEISNIDEMIAPGEYLFAKEDIEDMFETMITNQSTRLSAVDASQEEMQQIVREDVEKL